MKLPYTVGLFIAGALCCVSGIIPEFTLDKEFIYKVLLPPLIFEAAFFLRWTDLREHLRPVLSLAIFGTIFSALLIAGSMILMGWPVTTAAVFGTLISATDPVAVIAMFKDLKIGGTLFLLIEAESLLNDGVAAVLFSVALAHLNGTPLSGSTLILVFLQQTCGGIIIGAIFAGLSFYMASKTEDHLVELTLTTVAAFGSFLVAEHFQCSGVMSVLIAGFLIGNFGHFGSITKQGRQASEVFWEFAAFGANSIIFILIGVEETTMRTSFFSQVGIVIIAILVCILARGLTVYGICSVLNTTTKQSVSISHQHILFWGGLKGALSLALALGLPNGFPMRDTVITTVFGIVAFSILVQGMTMAPLMKLLKLR